MSGNQIDRNDYSVGASQAAQANFEAVASQLEAALDRRDADVKQAMAEYQADGVSDQYAQLEQQWNTAGRQVREVINGIRIAVGFAWTTVVAAELNNGIPGVGGLAYLAGQQLNTPLTIACIIVIGVTALLLDSLIKWIGLLAVPWKGKA